MIDERQFNVRRASLVLCALVALLLSSARVAAGASPSRATDSSHVVTSETREGRLKIFDDVWETVRARYYDPTLGGLDWEALRVKYRPAAAEARGREEFYTLLRRMLAHLDDPHTRVIAPGEGADWRETRYISVGVQLREVSGEVLVSKVERDSGAGRAGVRAGDALIRIGGEAARTLLARRLAELPQNAPTARAASAHAEAGRRLRAVVRLFDGPRDSLVEAVFRSGGGDERIVRLRRALVTRTPELRVRREGRVGVIEFNAFSTETAAGLARALRNELRGARALVFDLRDNGGGDAEAMTDIASMFLPPGRSLGRFNDRAGRVQLEPQTRSMLLSTADAPARFAGPVVVVVGARTASAAEVFAASLKESGRATSILGETTCGCVLGIRRRHALPDGGSLDVSEVDYRTAAGARLEGAGVTPDERIPLTRDDMRAARDTAMKRAVEILKAAM